jgi:hypothetical protein
VRTDSSDCVNEKKEGIKLSFLGLGSWGLSLKYTDRRSSSSERTDDTLSLSFYLGRPIHHFLQTYPPLPATSKQSSKTHW